MHKQVSFQVDRTQIFGFAYSMASFSPKKKQE